MLNFSNKNYKIVEKFKYFILVSIVITLVGVIMMCVKGINFGIDYTGGAKIEIELSSFAGDSDAQKVITDTVNDFFKENGCKTIGEPQISKASDGGATYEFRLAYYHNGDLKTAEAEQDFIALMQGNLDDDNDNGLCGELQTKLEEVFNTNSTMISKGATIDADSIRAYTVGATASSTLIRSAIIALVVAIIIMLIYIIIRFKFASALAAVCALIHDVIIMIALTTIFQITVNSTFIAAIITIVGYSINATIVVFDRIREETKFASSSQKTDAEIANKSIVATLGRTILTTLTTIIMIVLLAIFSVAEIRDFALPIIFGLIAGTFSSVFLASSFWVGFKKIGKKFKAKKLNKKSKGAVKAN